MGRNTIEENSDLPNTRQGLGLKKKNQWFSREPSRILESTPFTSN